MGAPSQPLCCASAQHQGFCSTVMYVQASKNQEEPKIF